MFDPQDLARYRQTLLKLAMPYKVDGKGRATPNDLPGVPIDAAGGLVSTVRDLARLDAALGSSPDRYLRVRAAGPKRSRPRGVPRPSGAASRRRWVSAGSCNPTGERVVWHFGYVQNGYSSLILKVPSRGLTFIILANGDGLSAPFQLESGDVTRSLFATLFLRLAV